MPESGKPRILGRSLLALALLLGTGEVLLRTLSHRDGDGQLWVAGIPLRPYRVPVTRVRQHLAEIATRGDSVFVHDPLLGWAPRASARSADGLYRTNAAGMRADHEPPREPEPGVLRVVALGDSFTFGDEVALEDTWSSQLERALRERGIAAEVLNLGVNGYGLDQAALRWETLGRAFSPHVVILGFQPENLLRDLNVFRPLYFPATDLPFSKPRFVVEGDGLVLINQPVVPPEELPRVLAALPDHPLAAHERFLGPGHEERWWLRSRLASLLASLAVPPGPRMGFHVDREADRVARGILARLAASVRTSGASLIVVHLPRREDLETIVAQGSPWYSQVLDWLAADHSLVRPDAGISEIRPELFRPRGHYAPGLHALVATSLADPVMRARLHH